MTDQPPRGATPDDIEAALQHVRAGLDAAPDTPLGRAHPGQRFHGLVLLMVVAVALVAASAAYFLPRLTNDESSDAIGLHGRVADLEARMRVLPAADAGAAEMRDLTTRLGALEARVRKIEAGAGSTGENSGDAAARIAALERSIGDIEQRLGTLGDQVAALAAAPSQPRAPSDPAPDHAAIAQLSADVQMLSTTLANLDHRLAALEAAAPNQDLVGALDRRISELENADPGSAARNAALALAISRLASAADSGRGFRVELEALKLVAPPPFDASPFEPYAANGLATVQALGAWLEGIDGAIRDGADADRGGDWFDRLWRGLAGLIVVKQAGEPLGSEAEDHLLRAERRLEKNDLAAALREIEALGGAARAPAEAWLIDARARLALDAALAQLTAKILTDLARQN